MKKNLITVLLIIVFTIIPSLIISQEKTNISTNKELFRFSDPESEVKAPGYFGMFIKTILILGIFGGVVYYVIKYISKKQGLSFPKLDIIQIITSIPVGTNRFLQIIEVGNKYYLIGSTDSNVNLLAEITDKDTLNIIKVMKNKENIIKKPPTFAYFMNNLLGGVKNRKISDVSADFLKKQKDRLKNFKI